MLANRGNDMEAEHTVLLMVIARTHVEFRSNYWPAGKSFETKTQYFTNAYSTFESDFW